VDFRYPEQKLTRAEALKGMTLDAAYAAHQENILGKNEVVPLSWI